MRPLLNPSRWHLPALLGAAVLTLASIIALPAAAQALELFGAERFAGASLRVDTNSRDLGEQRFRDRAASLVVRTGRWELCTEPRHRGTCVVFGPGRYDVLPAVLTQQIKSVRSVEVVAAAVPPAGPGTPSAPAEAPITLYEHAGLRGRSLAVNGPLPRMGSAGGNDMASSVDIARGRWQLCRHADFGEPCLVLGPGRHDLGRGFSDAVTSLRPVFGSDDEPLPARGGIVLYEHADFSGREVLRTEATRNLDEHGFNDRTSSVEVWVSRWELCTDAGFRGQCVTLGPGRHRLAGAFHDRVTSVRPR